jgi:CRISPR-associated protein Cmr6
MIGCHWEFTEASKSLYLPCEKLDTSHIAQFLQNIQQNLINLLGLTNITHVPNWREAWHPSKVEVWARIDRTSKAAGWFHGSYSNSQSIKRTALTGYIGSRNNPSKVGRIWHRMYPRYVVKNGILERTSKYVELLTIFPDESQNTQKFLRFLNSNSNDDKKFIKIFPGG